MRVLMSADTVGGVWSYALELADALTAHGVETTLAVTGEPLRPEQRRELRRSTVARFFAFSCALEWMPAPRRDLERAGEWLREIEADVRPDVVHLNGYAHGALDWQAPVVMVAHSCVLSWFEAVRRQPAPREWDHYRAAVAAGLEGADLVVAPTRAMLDAFCRLHPVRSETQVIPNGASPPADGAAKRAVVLAAGRLWDEGKNVVALARAAPRLPWPVEVAGDGDVPGLRGLGRLDRAELGRRMSEARVFCAPARYEPFGLAPLEAGLAGCALVLGDIPSLHEVWGDAALFVAPDDDEALVAALRRAMTDPGLGERARERARRYTPARMAEAYLDAYERVSTRMLETDVARV